MMEVRGRTFILRYGALAIEYIILRGTYDFSPICSICLSTVGLSSHDLADRHRSLQGRHSGHRRQRMKDAQLNSVL